MKTYKPEHETVLKAAVKEGATNAFAQLVLTQMMHESADFTSNVYKRNNNPMGMKVPRVRKSPYILGSGTKAPSNEGSTPYARFASLTDAVKDLFHWLRYNKIRFNEMETIKQYVEALRSKSYFGDSASGAKIYTAGLINNFKKLGVKAIEAAGKIADVTIPGSGSAILFIFLAVAALYFLTK